MSKIYHPDANPDNPDAQATFFEITRAYETLSDGKLRRIYDKGDLGRAISAADRELIRHKFTGEGFVDVSIFLHDVEKLEIISWDFSYIRVKILCSILEF